jgi:hypothetical protein
MQWDDLLYTLLLLYQCWAKMHIERSYTEFTAAASSHSKLGQKSAKRRQRGPSLLRGFLRALPVVLDTF